MYTVETVSVAKRDSDPLDYSILYRVNSILESFGYSGNDLIDIDQTSNVCNNPVPLKLA